MVGQSEVSVTGVCCFIPLAAPSMNSLLNVIWSQKRFETKPEIRLFRTQLKSYLPLWQPQPETLYRVHFSFLEDWLHGNGTLKRKDAPNLLKSCLDAVMERYQLDDCYILETTAQKVQEASRVGLILKLQRCGTVADFTAGRLNG